MSQQQFKKFINVKNNAAVKEKFKQEKKTAKKERAAAIEKRFEEKRAMRNAGAGILNQAPPKNDPRQKYPTSKPAAAGPKTPAKQVLHGQPGDMPLNKFMAHCGISSRREAIPYIKEGKVTVNGIVIKEPGHKIKETDTVVFNGKKLFVTRNQVYILLNKPKDYITTTDDPQKRKTVLELIRHATSERVYPVGRLDRNTSGVLLFTNDGDLTQKLTHPSFGIKKVYEAKLDKPLTKAHFDKIVNGLTLDDGEIHADVLAYADSKDRSIIGIEIHSGRNRIVRRIFEHLGYDVKGLDRVMYANLTKKNVERGKWRYLSEKEIRLLKYMNNSVKDKPIPGEMKKVKPEKSAPDGD